MPNQDEQLLFIKESDGWVPIPRVSRVIPFGYVLDRDDPNLLQPIPFELEALEKAKKHLKQFSLRETAQWLTQITGRNITYEGLRKRYKLARSRRGTKATLKNWTNRVQKAEETILRYQTQVPGSRVFKDSGNS
jgi:hypothetical protein